MLSNTDGMSRNRIHPSVSRNFTGLNEFNRKILAASNAYSVGESETAKFIKSFVKKHGSAPTDAFGEIDFGTSTSKTAKYVKVANDTNVAILYQLLTKHWKLKTPNLVISVTGGAKNFSLRARLKEVFRKSLIKASENTGAWITTGGTHAGVMKHVGKAVKNYAAIRDDVDRVVTIGIAPWGVIYGKQQLENHQQESSQLLPKQYDADEKKQDKNVVLDYNHSHFILVDNGTEGTYGTEIDLRNDLEAYIAKQQTRDGVNVMIVSVIVQGGPGSLKTVAGSIENGAPVVIVGGSGGWADILATVTMMSVDQVDENILEDLVLEYTPEADLSKLKEWTKMVNTCISKQNLLTVFALDPNDTSRDLDIAILEALLKAGTTETSQASDQLQLAMAWNRSDIAKSHILNDDACIGKSDIALMFFSALKENKHKFCEIFLDYGVDLKDYCTLGILESLYRSVPKDSIMYKKLYKGNCFSIERVGRAMLEYLGHSYISIYKKRLQSSKYCGILEKEIDESNEDWFRSPWRGDCKLDDPYREIFQWAILLNYREIAHHIWNYMFESMPAAIMATKMLKEMAKRMTHDHERQSQMLADAEEYENLAAGILGKCFSDNPDKAIPLLIGKLPKWGGYTTLHVAIEANDKVFVSRPCVQYFLDKVWMNKLADKTSAFHILCAGIIPIFILMTVQFKERERDEDQEIKALENGNAVDGSTPNVALEMDEIPEATTNHDDGIDGIDKLGFNDPEVDLRPSEKPFSVREKLVIFYDAPIVTFWMNVLSFVLYLVLFAFIVLSNFRLSAVTISAFEYVLLGWTSTFLFEEIRELADQEARYLREKILLHLKNVWNIMDLTSLSLFFIGFGLRWFIQFLSVALTLYSLAFMIQCIRIVHIFAVHSVLGPKIIMVGKMLKDLLFFLFILIVFLLAYGVASQALLYPNETNFGDIVVGIIYRPYWQIYGELFLEEINYNPNVGEFTCSDTNPSLPRCPQQSAIVPIISAVYLLFANVLLLNLLIAMFSYTFENVERQSNEIWMFQRYKLITDYYFRPPFVPPLIILAHIYHFINFVRRKIFYRRRDDPFYHALKMELDGDQVKQLRKWEHWHAEAFLREKLEDDSTKVDRQLEKLSDRIDNITSTIEDLQDRLKGPSQDGSGIKNLQTSLFRRFQVLEKMIASTHGAQGGSALPALSHSSAPVEPAVKKVTTPTVSSKPKPSPQVPAKEIQAEWHTKARSSPYPNTKLKRTFVPDDKVLWKVEWPEYKPISYNAAELTSSPVPPWADEDLEAYTDKSRPRLAFNKYDQIHKVNRGSHIGTYLVIDGLPRNPRGRTGLQGRGLLGRYGPNHAADPVVTRWKRDSKRKVVHINGKPVLEFAAIRRSDTGEWAIPGGMVDPGEHVSNTLKREFGEEALNIDGAGNETEVEKIKENIRILFKSGGLELFRGYCDDHRNTDYSWIETVACNFHDEEGTAFNNIKLNPGDDANKASWKQVDRNLKLFASHFEILKKAAEMHNAYF